MKSLLQALSKQGSSVVLVLVILVLLAWFGGESAGVSKKVRGAVVAGLLLAGLGLFVAQKVAQVRGALQIENKLREQGQQQVQSARPDLRPEVQAVQHQLDEAIQALKNSRLGKGALYALPWYMIIGPPGSGKTTALQESGLNFPYVSQGRKGIRGVGGTRNCDWWFTDSGILLDTAGRYTTEIDDREEWLSFLTMIKRARGRKPINGAIVAFSISDLLSATEEELEAHAKNIRDRIDELTKDLELVFPVYVLFTKCDLLHGFVEFFEDLGKGDRAQVWGCTLPFTPALAKPHREVFEEECLKLFASLKAQRLSTIASERPSAKKQSIFLFPLQFERAIRRLAPFVGALFRPNPYQETSVLRGFYFTSGTQEGMPIDQVIRAMSQAFGLPEEAAGVSGLPGDKKSYFINHLFSKIIFPDQNLARNSARVLKRRKLLSVATLGVSVVVVAFLLIGLVVSFFSNRGLAKGAVEALTAVRAVDWSKPGEADKSLEALERLRVRFEELDRHDRGAPSASLWQGFGLYQGRTLLPAARKAYYDALRKLFVEPAAERLEREMNELHVKAERRPDDDTVLDQLFVTYKVLGGELKVSDDATLKQVLSVLSEGGRWTARLGGGLTATAEKQLQFLGRQLRLDRAQEALVTAKPMVLKQIGADLTRTGRIHSNFQDIVTRRRAEAGTVAETHYVQPKPGEPPFVKFQYALSGLYTQRGRKTIVESEIEDRSKILAQDFARLGETVSAKEVSDRLFRQYQRQYELEWEQFRQGVKLEGYANLKTAVERMKPLVAEESPLPILLKGLLRDLTPADLTAEPDLAWVKKGLDVFARLLRQIESFATSPEAGRLAGRDGSEKVAPLQAAFVQAGQEVEAASAGAPPSQQLWGRFLTRQVLGNAWRALAAEAQSQVEAQWDLDVVGPYKNHLRQRRPFAEEKGEDAPIAEFTKLFSPAGKFWSIYDAIEKLRKVRLDEVPLVKVTREYEVAVDKALAFRALYAAQSPDRFSVPFSVKLQPGHGRVAKVRLEVAGETFVHDDEPTYTRKLIWAEGKGGGAKLTLLLDGAKDWSPVKEFAGEWAPLQLLASGNPQVKGEKEYACSWEPEIDYQGSKDKYKTLLTVIADEKVNPFRRAFFSEFVAPDKVGP